LNATWRDWLRARWRSIAGPLTSRDLWATLWSTLGLALLLFSYFLVRPIREVHGGRLGPQGMNTLFLLTFGWLLLVTPVWGWLVQVCSRRWLPMVLMSVIAGSLVVFANLLRESQTPEWVSIAFFVWVSVFNYMMVSLYWSVMVDSFSSETSRRTFGIIAAGGSAGAMVGPLVSSLIAKQLTSSTTLLIAAGLFLLVPLFLLKVPPREESEQPVPPAAAGDDSIWAGLFETINSSYLLAIAGYMLLGSVLGSLLYVHQAGAIREAIPLEADQRALYSQTDLAANVLTLVLELVVAAPLLAWGGLRGPLLALPVIGLVAAPLLTWSPSVTMIAAVLVIRRAIEYGLAKPTRELLFTVVSRSQKYKAKNFIDSVVARGGDSVGSSLSRFVTMQKWPPVVALWIGVPIALVFGGLGIWLAREQHRRAAEPSLPEGQAQ
jgi:AAA family ATP:ADP antiporter